MFGNRKNRNHGGKAMHRVRCALCAALTLVMCMSVFSGATFAAPTDEGAAAYTAEAEGEAAQAARAEGADETAEAQTEASGETIGADEGTGSASDADGSAIAQDTGTMAESIDAAEDADAAQGADSEDANAVRPLAASGDAGVSAFYVSAQVDGTAPWDGDNEAGDDSDASNNIVRTFDYVNYTLTYITELTDPANPVNIGSLYVEFTLPCGPDVASFNLSTVNWMRDPEVTYYLHDGTTTTEYENGDEVDKQVLTGYRYLVNTSDNTAIPGTGTLSVGVYIGAAKNGTTLKPEFTAWMNNNVEEDKKSVTNQQTLTISAAQKYNIGIRQSSEMNIAGTYDLGTGNENAAKDTVSGATSVRGRMEGYGITVMMQNDSVEKGLKGLEFPTDTITFDLTLSEQSENRSGTDLSSTAGYTPVIWDYDANLRKTAANGGSVGQWERTWVYTNAANMDCAYGAAPFNKLGCHTYSSIYDSCYDGGSWHMEQDTTNPLVYHVTISGYTIDYEDYNFPTANNTWYKRTEGGTAYTANQACLSAGTTQMVLQFPENPVNAPTYIYYKIVADNFKVGEKEYDTTAAYTNTYQLVPPGSIQSGTNFTDDTATTRAQSGHQLGSGYMEGDAYSFLGTNIRLWGYQSTTTDEYVRTNATLIKFDADAFEINRDDQYYANGRYAHGSGSGTVNSFTRYFAGRSENWKDTQEMSDTLINSTDLHYYTDLDALESAGYTCVGVLYIADVENINTSSQSYGMIGLTIKDDAALIGNVYAACNDSWASYSTQAELEGTYGAPVTEEGGTINTGWARNGYSLYKAYCSLDAYKTMKDEDKIESGNNGDYWYHKTVYDEDGNIISGHDVGYYGGTSLLVCGEKSTVEIKTDDTIYDMDAGERTTVVTVTPAVTVAGNASSGTEGGGTTTTTATVKVTLPFDLTYDVGTAKWGDEPITPEIIANDDGTTVLVFTLPDVILDATLDALTFECTIGHAGTSLDVQNNDSISLNATIESTNDHRAKSTDFGNSSNTSFNVIRLSATSISKSVDKRMIERDGSFTWTLNYYNGGEESITETEMADVFPTDGDTLGSHFSGSYSISEIELDFSLAPTSYEYDAESMGFYVSSDYSGTGRDLAENGREAGGTWTDLMGGLYATKDPDAKVITLDTSSVSDMTAFYCELGTLYQNDTVVVRISVKTTGNNPEDQYSNLYYEAATEQDAPVQSNVVSTQVVQRNLSGRTWIDINEDGIQDEDEEALAGATVTLYRESEVDSTAIRALAETQAVDVYGNTVEPVKTGADGSYTFENLPSGTYRVQFSVDGRKYALTKANAGDDDSVDSDATLVSNVDGSLIAEIKGLELPAIEEMDRFLYEDEHNDAGYYYAPVDITVTKEWDDADDQDGIRPESVTVRLYADGEPALSENGAPLTKELNESNDWTWTVTELPQYTQDGTLIAYTVTEDDLTGAAEGQYTPTVTGPEETNEGYSFTVTNSYTPELTKVSVEKAWDDADDRDGVRPESITIHLLADGDPAVDAEGNAITANVTADENGDWAYTFTDIPKYRDHGEEIVYTVTEDAVEKYDTTIGDAVPTDEGISFPVTNSYTPETTKVSVEKTWDDADNQDGLRPESIAIHLLADGEPAVDAEGTAITADVTADENGDWAYTFTDIPKYRDHGEEIVYTVTEDAVEGYETTVEDAVPTDEGVSFAVTNAHTPEHIDIEGAKTWEDDDNRDGVRPESITVHLLADGTPVVDAEGEEMSATVTEEDDWSWTFTDLPKYRDQGTEIVYTVTEDALENYSAEYDGCNVTNIHTPDQTSLTVTKVWDDSDDQDGIRPESIAVTLLADGEDTGKTLELTASDNWTGSFIELDLYRDQGVEIVYTVEEAEVPDGYEAAVTGDATAGYTITNTHTPEKTTTGTPTSHTGNEGNGGNGGSSGTGSSGTGSSGTGSSGTSGTGTAKTADTNATLWYVFLIALAGAAIVTVSVRRRIVRK